MWNGDLKVSLQSRSGRKQSPKETIKSVQKEKKGVYIILVLAGIIPVLCLCGFMLSQVILAAQKRSDALAARDDVYSFLAVDELIQSLSLERGRSSGYIRTDGQHRFIKNNFVQAIAGTNENSKHVDFSEFQSNLPEFSSRKALMDYMEEYRGKVWNLELSVLENQLFYLDLIENLIQVNEKIITLGRIQGELWREVAATGHLLRAYISSALAASLTL